MQREGRTGMELLLGALFMIGLGVRDANGWLATSQCVQVGQAGFNVQCRYSKDHSCLYNVTNHLLDRTSLSYHTIGAYKFKTTHFFLDSAVFSYLSETDLDNLYVENIKLVDFVPPTGQVCPYTHNETLITQHRVKLCPTDDEVKIRAFAVKQNGVVMRGWLHFEVELTDKADDILGIYVQVRDEWYNAIGEFISKPEEQCQSTNSELVNPTAYQVLPCSAIGFREAKVSTALLMVDPLILKNQTAGQPYLTTKPISRGIHFTWRLSEYWCNRHLRFRPEAIVFTKKMYDHNDYKYGDPPVYRKAAAYWMFPKWYGSADIKLDGTTLTCDKEVIDYTVKDPKGSNITLEKNPDNTLVAPWLHEIALASTLDNDYVAESQSYYDNTSETFAVLGYHIFSVKSCHANTRHPYQASFSGRCTHHYEKTPSHNALQGCNLDVDAPEFVDLPKDLPTYNEYVHILTINRTRQCTTSCRAPANMEDLKAIQQFESASGSNKGPQILKFTNIGATRHDSKVKKFWAARKFHGQLLTFWSMFLIPVGSFASRYLKETAMSHVCIGFHMWFWIHLATIILGGGMLGCAYLALYDLVNTFGRSLNEFSVFHRILSISSIVIFVFMAVLGGFRTRSIPVRKVLLFLHSFLGFLVYFLNLTAMVISTWIPASPSMANVCDDDGRPQGLSYVALVTMAWLVVDILTHIGMTVLQILVDRRYGVIRTGFYCPIVPFLPPESIKDLKGKHFRKIIFLVYSLVALAFAMTVIVMLSKDEIPFECRNKTGPTTCDDPWGCSNWAQAYSHRYPRKPTEAPKAAN